MTVESQSFHRWTRYFDFNRANLLKVPWDHPYRLSPGETKAITHSIQAFQLGESSEGRHFLRLAEKWCRKSEDPSYLDALRFFIAEEQRHAADLGRFMDDQGIARRTFDWTDSIFRVMRHALNLELCISVLIAAEIIAKVYYKALRDATHAPQLTGLCKQILNDEVQHILFQTQALRRIRQGRSRFTSATTHAAHRAFMLVTMAVVWREHRHVFNKGRYTFVRFVGETLCELEDAILLMKGDRDGLASRSGEDLSSHLAMCLFDT